MPATVRIGSDRYAAKETRVTAQTVTVAYGYGLGGSKTFRKVKGHWCNGHYTLTLGKAETELDPSF
jgi:hypothetical protein